MHLKNIKILNFKNCEDIDIEFSPKINCFTGLNGVGKTNLLDAISYMSLTKSYIGATDSQNVKYNSDFFVIEGDFFRKERIEKIYCGYKKSKKKNFKRNDKTYSKFSEHIGLLPSVMISPYDSRLIIGRSEERRKFVDSVISQYDRQYLENIIRYNRILEQRNALLKNFMKNNYFDADTLEIYNEQLADKGTKIHETRKEFIDKLIPIFNKFYQIISQEKEQVSIQYKSHLNAENFIDLLKQNTEKDRILQHTSVGTHRDDLIFKIGDYPIKKSGSQGQQKTFLIALKFAQFEFTKDNSGLKPILLLDDIFDKFDTERVGQIMKITSENTFGQIFITDTNPDRLDKVLSSENIDYKLFKVNNGGIVNNE